jgi:hypothetical protein
MLFEALAFGKKVLSFSARAFCSATMFVKTFPKVFRKTSHSLGSHRKTPGTRIKTLRRSIKSFRLKIKQSGTLVKGFRPSVKRCGADFQGFRLSVKGFNHSVKGYFPKVKGFNHSAKRYFPKVKRLNLSVKGLNRVVKTIA